MNCNHPESDMDDEDDCTVDEAMFRDGSSVACYSDHISSAEYQKQSVEYTKAAVQSLISSPEYQRVYTRCRLCWSSWSEGQFSNNCFECGGYAMIRPCPVCQGRCGAVWKRDVDMSHSNNEAHWDGDCLLPSDERQGYLMQLLLTSEVGNESDLLDAMQDLTTK